MLDKESIQDEQDKFSQTYVGLQQLN